MDKDVSLTFNDISILEAVFDIDTKQGFAKSNGTTVKEIQDKTNFSLSKIRSTLQKFKSMGWITEGIKLDKNKTYCVTEEGYLGLNDLSSVTVDKEVLN